MAVPVARVHLSMAHAALPALLPTPPKWKMLPLLPPPPCVAAILGIPKPLTKQKQSRADSEERWDARKTKPASMESSASSSLLRGSSLPPKPGRADCVERWDAHKKAASPPASSSSSSGTSSPVVRRSRCTISRASSGERRDVHKKRRPQQVKALDDGKSSSTGSNGIDTKEEEEEILWKPRAMYAGPGFVVAAPEFSMLPMPTAFLVRVG